MGLKMKFSATLLALSCFAFIATSQADTYKVLKVIDGDTIKIVGPYGKKRNIRFYGIDCPETPKEHKRG